MMVLKGVILLNALIVHQYGGWNILTSHEILRHNHNYACRDSHEHRILSCQLTTK